MKAEVEMSWLEQTSQGVLIRVQVQPKASQSKIVGPHGEPVRLKIRIAAPPVDGKANEELVRFLKKVLKISSSQIQLLRGHTSHMKDLLVCNMPLEDVLRGMNNQMNTKSKSDL